MIKGKRKIERRLRLRKLAKALQIDPSQLSKELRRSGAPRPDAGGKFSIDAVAIWREHNINIRSSETPAPTSAPAPAPPALSADDAALLAVLQNPVASGLDRSRAAAQLASLRVARASADGTLGAADLRALNDALSELRRGESDYQELAIARRDLMNGDDARRMVGEGCAVALRCVENLCNAIAPEFAIWLVDPAIQALPADARANKIRQFVEHVCREVRMQAARDWRDWLATLSTDD